MMDGPKYAEMRKYAGKFENSLDESDDTNTDWQDLLYRTGMVNSHDVSVAGGTNNGSYSLVRPTIKIRALFLHRITPVTHYEAHLTKA